MLKPERATLLPILVAAVSVAAIGTLLIGGWTAPLGAGAGLLIVATVGLALSGPRGTNRTFEVRLFLGAFAIRCACTFALYGLGAAELLGSGEDSTLWVFGSSLSERWAGSADAFRIAGDAFDFIHERRDGGYFVLLGLFFHLLGESTQLLGGMLSAWIGSITVVVVYRLGFVLFGHEPARKAGLLACCMPSLVIWSSQTLKEPVVIFLEVLALYWAIRFQNRAGVKYAAGVGLCVLTLLTVRFYTAYIVAGAAVIGIIAAGRFADVRARAAAILAAFLLIPAVNATGLLDRDRDYLSRFNVEYVSEFKEAVSTGPGSNSGVVNRYDLHSPLQFLAATVVGGAHLLMAPFPWQLGSASLRMLLTVPELIFWWWLLFWAVIPGLRRCLKNPPPGLTTLLLFSLTLGLLYSVLFANIGLAFRQRAQLLPYLLLMAGVGLHARAARREELRAKSAQRYAWRGRGSVGAWEPRTAPSSAEA